MLTITGIHHCINDSDPGSVLVPPAAVFQVMQSILVDANLINTTLNRILVNHFVKSYAVLTTGSFKRQHGKRQTTDYTDRQNRAKRSEQRKLQ
jgi:hypothetical protein